MVDFRVGQVVTVSRSYSFMDELQGKVLRTARMPSDGRVLALIECTPEQHGSSDGCLAIVVQADQPWPYVNVEAPRRYASISEMNARIDASMDADRERIWSGSEHEPS